MNVFSLGAQIGGPDHSTMASASEQQLRDELNRWKGEYSRDVKEFAFLLRIDGEFHKYTEMWKIIGFQQAKCKRDWIEVEIGIPQEWWREIQGGAYKRRLASEVESGLKSMIEVLKAKKKHIEVDALLSDWEQVKVRYLHRG